MKKNEMKSLAATSLSALALCLGANGGIAAEKRPVSIQSLEIVDEKKVDAAQFHKLVDGSAGGIVTAGNYPDVLTAASYPNVLTSSNYPNVLTSSNYPNVLTSSNYPNVTTAGNYGTAANASDAAVPSPAIAKAMAARFAAGKQPVSIQSLEIVDEKKVDAAQFHKLVDGSAGGMVTSGNFGDMVTSGNFASMVTSGNFASMVTSGNFGTAPKASDAAVPSPAVAKALEARLAAVKSAAAVRPAASDDLNVDFNGLFDGLKGR